MGNKPLLKQIVHAWIYQSIEFEKMLEHLKKIGADGVDLTVFEPNLKMLMETDVKALMKSYGLGIYCSTFGNRDPDADFSHPDVSKQEKALDFNKRCLEAAANVGCDRVLISGCIVTAGPITFHTTREEDWARAVQGIRKVAEAAQQYNIMCLVEPVNRYMSKIVHTVDEALQVCREVDMPNVHVVPDTYHMNIEEDTGIERALRRAGKDLKVLHIGDNTRRAPGHGTLDWRSIIGTLYDMGFDGPLSYETVYTKYYYSQVDKNPEDFAYFENELAQGIKYLKNIMENMD